MSGDRRLIPAHHAPCLPGSEHVFRSERKHRGIRPMVAGPAAPITTLHCQHCQAEVLDLGVDGRYVVQATLTAPAWTFTSAMQGGTAACPACQEPISAGQRVGLWYRLDGKDARTYHAACAPSVAPEVV